MDVLQKPVTCSNPTEKKKTSIQYYSTVHIVGLHTYSVHKTFEYFPNLWPPPFDLPRPLWGRDWEHVSHSGLYLIRNLPMSSASSTFSTYLTFFFFFLVLSLSEIVTLCCALSIYASQMKLYEMHLWGILQNWLIIGWSNNFTFSSLVKFKIYLRNSSIQDTFA